MPTTTTLRSQSLELNPITDIEVTTIVDDGDGGYVRAIKFFGEGATEDQKPLVLEVRVRASAQVNLKITTPEIDF